MYISSDWCRAVWAVSKNESLRHGYFYFRVAGFTHLSPLPEVDKSYGGLSQGDKRHSLTLNQNLTSLLNQHLQSRRSPTQSPAQSPAQSQVWFPDHLPVSSALSVMFYSMLLNTFLFILHTSTKIMIHTFIPVFS